MKKLTIFLLSSALFMTSCSAPAYKNGKKFTFDDKELESKMVYFCQDKPNLAPMVLRAEKAHQYFTKENDKNAQMLIDNLGKGDRQLYMKNFQQQAEVLALNLHKKFSCTLIDTIDY